MVEESSHISSRWTIFGSLGHSLGHSFFLFSCCFPHVEKTVCVGSSNVIIKSNNSMSFLNFQMRILRVKTKTVFNSWEWDHWNTSVEESNDHFHHWCGCLVFKVHQNIVCIFFKEPFSSYFTFSPDFDFPYYWIEVNNSSNNICLLVIRERILVFIQISEQPS
jgi:hypothetical protein